VPLVQPVKAVVDLAWPGHADAMPPLTPWEDPPQGRPRSRLVDLVRHRLPLARQGVAPAAWRHGIDQPRSGHHQQQPWHPTGCFHQPRRDHEPWIVEQPTAAFGLGLLSARITSAALNGLASIVVPTTTPALRGVCGPTGSSSGRTWACICQALAWIGVVGVGRPVPAWRVWSIRR